MCVFSRELHRACCSLALAVLETTAGKVSVEDLTGKKTLHYSRENKREEEKEVKNKNFKACCAHVKRKQRGCILPVVAVTRPPSPS